MIMNDLKRIATVHFLISYNRVPVEISVLTPIISKIRTLRKGFFELVDSPKIIFAHNSSK